MASFDISTCDTMSGASLALNSQENARTDTQQWLTQSITSHNLPFYSQTLPVQPFAQSVMLLDFDHTEFTNNKEQTFECKIPTDQLDLIGALTAIVNVPSIANQTSTAVTKKGIDSGVTSMSTSIVGSSIASFSGFTVNVGWDTVSFPVGTTEALVLDTTTVATGSGFAATITRNAAADTWASYTLTVTNPGSGYTNTDAVNFTFGVIGNLASHSVATSITTFANALDGSDLTIAFDAAPATGQTATATAATVPAGVVSSYSGIDFTITNPGHSYSTAPDFTISGGGLLGTMPGTSTLTSTSTGENLRYIVPGTSNGQYQSNFPASDSTVNSTNIGTTILIESDIDKTYGNVSRAINNLSFNTSATDSNYYDPLTDNGVQDAAAYFTPFAASMMFTEVQLFAGSGQIDGCIGEQILDEGTIYQPKRYHQDKDGHASFDKQKLKRWSSFPSIQWHVRFPLFTVNSKSPYPAVAARTYPLKLVCKTRKWTDLICNGSGGQFASLENSHAITVSGQTVNTVKLETSSTDQLSNFLTNSNPATTSADTAVQYSDFSMQLMVEGYMVGSTMRTQMQTQNFMIPYIQHLYPNTMDPDTILKHARQKTRVPISFEQPLTALKFTGRLKSSELQHQWADFGAATIDPLSQNKQSVSGKSRLSNPLFKTCHIQANGRVSLSIERNVEDYMEPQQREHGQCVMPELNICGYHFCAESPNDIQHSSYADAGAMDKFDLIVQADPAVFENNLGVRGLNGKSSGSTVTVTGGQEITLRYWASGRNLLVVKNGTVKPLFR